MWSPYHEIRWMKVREAMSEMNLRADEAYEWASMKLADTPAVRGARSATLTTPLENKCSGFIPFSCAAQLKPPTHILTTTLERRPHENQRTRRWRACARLLGLRYPTDGDEPEVIIRWPV